MAWFDEVAAQSAALLLGGVTGGMLGAIALAATWWWDSRRRTAQELLRDGFQIHASLEAWILESSADRSLSETTSLSTEPNADKPWLRAVEVRLVLDQSPWNAPAKNFYGLINGRRVWIVRDRLLDGDSYPRTGDVRDLHPYPALLSSKALHELSGWIERIASLCFWRIWPLPRCDRPIGLFLSDHDIRSLWPLLAPVRGEDRIQLLTSRLSLDAQNFLRWYREKYPQRDWGYRDSDPPGTAT